VTQGLLVSVPRSLALAFLVSLAGAAGCVRVVPMMSVPGPFGPTGDMLETTRSLSKEERARIEQEILALVAGWMPYRTPQADAYFAQTLAPEFRCTQAGTFPSDDRGTFVVGAGTCGRYPTTTHLASEPLEVMPLGRDLVVVSGGYHAFGTPPEPEWHVWVKCARLFRRHDGRWQAVYSYEIAQPPPAGWRPAVPAR